MARALASHVNKSIRAPRSTNRAPALELTPESLNTLLDPGYHAVETGYCEHPDGSAYMLAAELTS